MKTLYFIFFICTCLISQIPEDVEFTINTTLNGEQTFADVCTLIDDKFVVTWLSSKIGDEDLSGVFYQVFYKDGTKYGLEKVVDTISTYTIPHVVSLYDSGFVITWANGNLDHEIDSDIFAQKFDINGNKLSEKILVNTFTEYRQTYPSIDILHNGGFVICWSSENQDSSLTGIYAQRFNNDGFKEGTEFRVNNKNENAWIGDVCVLGNNKLVFVWNGSSPGYRGRIFDSDGSEIGEEIDFGEKSLNIIHVAGLTDNNFGVVWTRPDDDYHNYAHYISYLQYDQFGSRLFNERVELGLGLDPYISVSQNGDILLTWDVNGGIKAQLLDKAGQKRGNFLMITSVDSIVKETVISSSSFFSDGKFITTWFGEKGTTGYDIIGKILDIDSVLSIDVAPYLQPDGYILYQNFPNPFNSKTKISYTIDRNCKVEIEFYSINGNLLSRISQGMQSAGYYELNFDANDFASGMYFYRLKIDNIDQIAKKMVLLK